MARKTREPQIIVDDVRIANRIDIGGTQVTATAAELNILDGVTATAAEINTVADGITATAAELNVLDGVTAGTTTASKALVVDANKALDFLALGGVAPSAAALTFGIGASATRATTATADKNFVEFRTESTATSGDSRGIYNRLYLGGAAVSGESLRTFTTVDDVAAATAHGAHISLNFNATGSVTGLGVASRCTLHVPDDAGWTPGTIAAVQAEIWSDGDASDTDGATEVSFIRVVNGGNANGIADVDDDAFLLAFSGGAIGAGNMVAAQTAAAVSHTIRCKMPDGSTGYLMVSDTQ